MSVMDAFKRMKAVDYRGPVKQKDLYEDLPPGRYTVKPIRLEFKKSKAGRYMAQAEYEVTMPGTYYNHNKVFMFYNFEAENKNSRRFAYGSFIGLANKYGLYNTENISFETIKKLTEVLFDTVPVQYYVKERNGNFINEKVILQPRTEEEHLKAQNKVDLYIKNLLEESS